MYIFTFGILKVEVQYNSTSSNNNYRTELEQQSVLLWIPYGFPVILSTSIIMCYNQTYTIWQTYYNMY